jgi:hypothetical protein
MCSGAVTSVRLSVCVSEHVGHWSIKNCKEGTSKLSLLHTGGDGGQLFAFICMRVLFVVHVSVSTSCKLGNTGRPY